MAHQDPNITVSLGPEFPHAKKVTLDALKFDKDSRPSVEVVACVVRDECSRYSSDQRRLGTERDSTM